MFKRMCAVLWRCASTSALALICGCQPSNSSDVSLAEREAIVQEIKQTIDEYGNANLRKDLDAQLSYFSDSEGFIFAGDGTILGGYSEWAEQLRHYDQVNQKWDYWNISNLHVVVLSREAASATYELEYGKELTSGDTVRQKGAWTSVFKKYDGKWRVIHTNGAHIPLDGSTSY